MKSIMYVDCTRGIASDMFVAALLDCFEDKDSILQELQFNIRNNMTLSADNANSYERSGLLFKAISDDWMHSEHKEETVVGHDVHNEEHHSHHEHSSLVEVHNFIDGTGFSKRTKSEAKGVYDIIARAEAEVHGADVNTVHFHEVGQKRAVACIVCACALIDKINPDEIVFSGINTGFGKVRCAHGEVDVPAPATRVILRDIPNFYVNTLGGELCTPTGTALAKFFADSFIPQSDLTSFRNAIPSNASKVGIGLGLKDIGIANGVEVIIVEN